MFSEPRRFPFSSVILSYLPLSSSKEERELERDGPDTTDYKREEPEEMSFVRPCFQLHCSDQYAIIGNALSELRGQ